MSHLGSYEVAARAFQKYGLKLLLMMGEKEARQVARDQREALKEQGITIQVASGEKDSVLGGLEAIKFIREGGFVSLAGDLIWTEQRALLPVKFFGREVGLGLRSPSSGPGHRSASLHSLYLSDQERKTPGHGPSSTTGEDLLPF